MIFRNDDTLTSVVKKHNSNNARKLRTNENSNQKHSIIKIATYIRVSTEGQAEDGHSLTNQDLELEQYIHNHHLFFNKEVKILKFADEGISAKSIKHRKDLMRLLQAVHEHEIDFVLITKLDRLTRKVIDLYQLVDFFEQHDVGLLSVHENLETRSASGRAFIGILGVMAQLEREQTGERTYDMFKSLVKKQYLGGITPYGYIYVSKDDSSQHIPYVSSSLFPPLQLSDTGELVYPGEIVKLVFEYYLSYHNFTVVANKLTTLGIPTPIETFATIQKFQSSDDSLRHDIKGIEISPVKAWNSNQIKYILTNPFYTGIRQWNKYNKKKHKNNAKSLWIYVNNAYPPLISEDVFNQVSELLASKRRKLIPEASSS